MTSILAAAEVDASLVDERRICGWCRGPIPPGVRRDARFCGQRCRQNAHKFVRGAQARPTADEPIRLGYADPPYPGLSARYYADHPDFGGEVDHQALVDDLVARFPDGWALSTSAAALPDVLALCPDGARVAAWVRGDRGGRSWAPLSAWEPVIYVGGRARLTEGDDRRVDVLVYRRCVDPSSSGRIRRRPPANGDASRGRGTSMSKNSKRRRDEARAVVDLLMRVFLHPPDDATEPGRRPKSPLSRTALEAVDWLAGKRIRPDDPTFPMFDPDDLRRLLTVAGLRIEAGRPTPTGRQHRSELTPVEAEVHERLVLAAGHEVVETDLVRVVHHAVLDEDGEPVLDIEGEPVTEAVVLSETNRQTVVRRPPADPVDKYGQRALRDAIKASRLLMNVYANLRKMGDLAAGAPADPPGCELCATASIKEPWDTYGSVGGRLDRSMHLCGPHRWFIERNDRIPTVEETRHHNATGRWRLRRTA